MVIACPASNPIAPGWQSEFARLFGDIRQVLSITRTQVAHRTGLSLFITVAVENGTIAHLQPYLPILARGYRLEEYVARRQDGQGEDDGPDHLASCALDSDALSEPRPPAASRARRTARGAERSLRVT